MKKQALQLTWLCLLVVFAATRTVAQSRVTVKVPFDFSISDRTFPAGQYSISSSHDRLTVQNSAGKPVFIGIANQVSGRRVCRTGMVVFHCYDARCFLSELWSLQGKMASNFCHPAVKRQWPGARTQQSLRCWISPSHINGSGLDGAASLAALTVHAARSRVASSCAPCPSGSR
jgi:hypothetical protein